MQTTNTVKTYATRNIFGPIIFKMTADPKRDFTKKQIEDEKKQFACRFDGIRNAADRGIVQR